MCRRPHVQRMVGVVGTVSTVTVDAVDQAHWTTCYREMHRKNREIPRETGEKHVENGEFS